jgi:hypothetical protein
MLHEPTLWHVMARICPTTDLIHDETWVQTHETGKNYLPSHGQLYVHNYTARCGAPEPAARFGSCGGSFAHRALSRTRLITVRLVGVRRLPECHAQRAECQPHA